MVPSTITRSLLIAFLVLLCFKSSCADNITQIMKGYPDFSKMTEILSQPDVAKQIKIQYAVTILGLNNDVMDKLFAVKLPEEVTDIVKCHVILDYYDEAKLKNRPLNKPAEMVNLYQSSGSSQYGQGLIKLKRTSQGVVFFSSSINSTSNDAKFVEKIYVRQFNVSVIKIDHPVYVLGLNDDMAPAVAPAPAKAEINKAEPAEAPEEVVAESPDEGIGTYEVPSPAPAPADGPDAELKKDADDVDDAQEAASSAGKRVVRLAIVLASALLAAVGF